METVTYKNIKFQVWDLGGQTSIRPYWRCYYPNTQAIIYVVDSSDTDRIKTSAGEFHAILEEEELKDALILVYANKQVNLLHKHLHIEWDQAFWYEISLWLGSIESRTSKVC